MGSANSLSLKSKFKTLLRQSSSERPSQRFLEKHPKLLLFGVGGPAQDNIVISQFPLGPDFRADFAYLAIRTGRDVLTLVEIESPKLKIFGAKDEFSQAFNHALQQLEDWSRWCKDNRQTLLNMFASLKLSNPIVPEFRLIAGRRHQVNNPRRKRRYSEKVSSLAHGFSFSTYDSMIHYLPDDFSDHHSHIRCVSYGAETFSLKEAKNPR